MFANNASFASSTSTAGLRVGIPLIHKLQIFFSPFYFLQLNPFFIHTNLNSFLFRFLSLLAFPKFTCLTGLLSTMASAEVSSTNTMPPEFDFKLYRYTPSLIGAAVTAVVFGALTSLHFWRMLRARASYFTPFLIGGVCKSNYNYRVAVAAQ